MSCTCELAGKKDWELREYCFEHSLTLVTNNGKDFTKLLGEVELHPGLVIILPNVRPGEQVELFDAILEYLEERSIDYLTNTVVEVDEEATVETYPLP